MPSYLLAAAGAGASALASASAKRDYETDERLSARTQALMWPAYLLGGAVVIRAAGDAGARGSRSSLWLGSLCGAGGLGLVAGGIRPFHSFGQLAGRETGGLITGGVYRLSRHPQYLGILLVSAGAAIAGRSLPAMGFTAVAAAAYSTYVPAEEEHLERVFGEEYRDYRAQVPRWIGAFGRRRRRI